MNAMVHSVLRQRSPFLFVEAYRAFPEEVSAETTFSYTGAEPFFAGHFPGNPVVPGVLLIEAMAQAARVALVSRFDNSLQGYLANVSRARFNKLVRPPQTIRFVARLKLPEGGSIPENFIEASCSAFAGTDRVANVTLTLSVHRASASS